MRRAYWAYRILSIPSTFEQSARSLPDWPADSRENVFAVPGCSAAGKPKGCVRADDQFWMMGNGL